MPDKLPMLRDARTGDWCVLAVWVRCWRYVYQAAPHLGAKLCNVGGVWRLFAPHLILIFPATPPPSPTHPRIGTFAGHKGAVWSARLNADATRAATGSADFTVKVWDAVGGGELATLEHGHVVKSVDFSADGARLATGGGDKTLRVFALERGGEPATLSVSTPDRIRKVAWGADGETVFTGSDDGVVRAYDARVGGGRCVREAALGAGAVGDLEVSHDGSQLTIAAGREVLLLGAQGLDVLRRHTLGFAVSSASLRASASGSAAGVGASAGAGASAGGAGGRRIIAGGADMHVHLLDADSGAELVCHKGHHGTVHCVRFAPDGETYVSGADDAIIRIWKYEGEKGVEALS